MFNNKENPLPPEGCQLRALNPELLILCNHALNETVANFKERNSNRDDTRDKVLAAYLSSLDIISNALDGGPEGPPPYTVQGEFNDKNKHIINLASPDRLDYSSQSQRGFPQLDLSSYKTVDQVRIKIIRQDTDTHGYIGAMADKILDQSI